MWIGNYLMLFLNYKLNTKASTLISIPCHSHDSASCGLNTSPRDSHVWTLGPQFVALWGNLWSLREAEFLLEDVGHRRLALRLYSLAPLPVTACFLCTDAVWPVSLQPLPPCFPCLDGLYSPGHDPCKPFSPSLFVGMLFHSREKVTKAKLGVECKNLKYCSKDLASLPSAQPHANASNFWQGNLCS